MQGSYQAGLFLYVATRADGAVATFPFAWQATAWCNGWAPPALVTIRAQP